MTITLRNTALDAFADRVLELNRAAAVIGDLANSATTLANMYGRVLPQDDNADLADAIDHLLADARAKWLHGTDAGLDRDTADHYRGKAIDRARHLAATAEAAREAAEALALILEGTAAFDTAEHLEWLITGAENNHRAGDQSYDLTELWLRLSQAHHSPAIAEADADRLRCEFDRALARLGGHDDDTGLGAEVHIWRDDYLKYRADWDTHGTWAYAIDTARTWPEARRYWETLPEATRGGTISPGENIDLHDRILARADAMARAFPASADDPDRAALHEAAAHYNTDHTPLMARIRAAETMAALWHVDGVVDNLEGDKLNLEAAIARKFDRLKNSAPDAADAEWSRDTEPWETHREPADPWGPGARLAAKVTRWRQTLHTAALTAGERNADPEYTYRLVYAALADARLWTDAEAHVRELCDAVDVLEARGQITGDHASRLRAMATADDARETTSQ